MGKKKSLDSQLLMICDKMPMKAQIFQIFFVCFVKLLIEKILYGSDYSSNVNGP